MAEGVGTAEQAERLRLLGVGLGQAWSSARPLRAEASVRRLSAAVRQA